MANPSREEIIAEFSERMFNAMLGEVVMDMALQVHNEVRRSNAVCEVCNTRCGSVHVPVPATLAPPRTVSSRAHSPSSTPTKPSVNGTSTPTNGVKDSNILLDCVRCSKQIASNRFASHLAKCMGVLNSGRRGISRNASKLQLGSDAGRSASPFIGSDTGGASDDPLSSPTKNKDLAHAANGKRLRSPETESNHSPSKMSKKQKMTESHGASSSRLPSRSRSPSVSSHSTVSHSSPTSDGPISSQPPPPPQTGGKKPGKGHAGFGKKTFPVPPPGGALSSSSSRPLVNGIHHRSSSASVQDAVVDVDSAEPDSSEPE